MNNDLIKNSQMLYETANKVVKKARVFEVLSKLGKVEIVGGLRLKLMYRLDIDIFVISENIDKNKAKEVTKEFLENNVFQTVALADYQNFPVAAPEMPTGFFWELIVPHEGKNWKFDIWYLRSDENYLNLVLSSLKKFEEALAKDSKKAEIILKIKEAYFDGVKYKNNVKSFDIYKAVLENGVNSVEEFTNQFKKSEN